MYIKKTIKRHKYAFGVKIRRVFEALNHIITLLFFESNIMISEF